MRRNHLLIAGASILVLMLGACSDDDDNGGKADTGPGHEAGADIAVDDDGDVPDDDTGTPVGGNVCVVTCSEDAQCGENLHCLDGACVMCTEDADCEIEAYGGIMKGGCDLTSNFCRQCAEDADCNFMGTALGSGVCHESGYCIGCLEDADCEYVGSPGAFCEGQACVMCIEDADCAGNAAGEYCLNYVCTMCQTDAHCADEKMKGCHVASGSCSLCTADEQCAGDLTCNTATGGCECDDASECEDLFPDTLLDLACQAQ